MQQIYYTSNFYPKIKFLSLSIYVYIYIYFFTYYCIYPVSLQHTCLLKHFVASFAFSG